MILDWNNLQNRVCRQQGGVVDRFRALTNAIFLAKADTIARVAELVDAQDLKSCVR